MKRSPIRILIIIGAGTALFFLLGYFLTVPSPVPGSSLPFHYGFLSFLSVICGPAVGLSVGILGQLVIDLAWGAGVWWSWIVASGVFGLLMGLAGRHFRFCRRPFGLEDAAAFLLCVVVSHLVCWVVIAPVLDASLYGGPYGQMLLQGLVTGALNAAVTAVTGLLLCVVCSALRRQKARRRRDHTAVSGKTD